jgi:uncharacterized membrane protein
VADADLGGSKRRGNASRLATATPSGMPTGRAWVLGEGGEMAMQRHVDRWIEGGKKAAAAISREKPIDLLSW